MLQTYIRPGSYKTSAQTLGVAEQIDPHFSNTELEWATKERGAIVLGALLLKVEWRLNEPYSIINVYLFYDILDFLI